ncbi:MAG: phosphoribosylamine--glycine ligase [Betaproteobacteria bacterium]
MRLLGIGEEGDLGAMYYGLARAGHEVRMYIDDPAARGIYAGMLEATADWRAELPWIRAAGEDGVIVFESAVRGELQDRLRGEGFQVIGGSAFGDRLEADRAFGQAQLEGLGLRVAGSHAFDSFAEAIDLVRTTKRRYVFKSNGAASLRTRNYIGQMDNGDDMVALLHTYARQWRAAGPPDFVLMDHVEGVEVGVGAYFNGSEFLEPACLDWEHKRFFPGELGELTGEMGTIVTYRGYERIFAHTLKPMARSLRAGGYVGYINLNLIANEAGLWPIEFTSRFGYPGFSICEALHDEPWDAIFRKMLGSGERTIRTRAGFAAGVVLTVPPFPYSHGYEELSRGLPICLDPGMTESERGALHLAEVAIEDGQLVTSGLIGYLGVATGTGASVEDARDRAYQLARKVIVPNLRYRDDIGARVIERDLDELARLGYLGP